MFTNGTYASYFLKSTLFCVNWVLLYFFGLFIYLFGGIDGDSFQISTRIPSSPFQNICFLFISFNSSLLGGPVFFKRGVLHVMKMKKANVDAWHIIDPSFTSHSIPDSFGSMGQGEYRTWILLILWLWMLFRKIYILISIYELRPTPLRRLSLGSLDFPCLFMLWTTKPMTKGREVGTSSWNWI